MAVQTRYLSDESDHMKREQGTAESQGDLEATSSVAFGGLGNVLRDDTMHHVPTVACHGSLVEGGMGD
jgi:hypothetical protein